MKAISMFSLWLVAVAEASAQASQTPPATEPSYPRVTIGGLWYLAYQNGELNDTDYSQFVIKRGYINVEARINSFLSGRITPDTTQELNGDVKVRLKYAYAKLSGKPLGFITRPEVEFGIVHMPWLDFEEHVNRYRMQDTMFMERNGLFDSADFGVVVQGLLGGTLPPEYQAKVTPDYPGRRGSFSFGVFNGGGYHASERNENKAFEGRLTLRPAPDQIPGLQISYFGVIGKGNTPSGPDWDVNAIMASYESEHLVLTGTWMVATGNQRGDGATADGQALDRDGWSVFGEGRINRRWSVIARYDVFDPNRDAAEDTEKRAILGVAYDLGRSNFLLVDYDRVDFDRPGRAADSRAQVTFQLRF